MAQPPSYSSLFPDPPTYSSLFPEPLSQLKYWWNTVLRPKNKKTTFVIGDISDLSTHLTLNWEENTSLPASHVKILNQWISTHHPDTLPIPVLKCIPHDVGKFILTT